jgi:hypothetical protein
MLSSSFLSGRFYFSGSGCCHPMFCQGGFISLVVDAVLRCSVREGVFIPLVADAVLRCSVRGGGMLSPDVLSGRFYSSGSGCCPPMFCQGGFIPLVVDVVLRCSVRDVLEFRRVSVLCFGSCVLFYSSFVPLVLQSIIMLMFSVMLFTALTVMYTVDSLFLRMFCFCAQRPVFTAVRLLITLNSRLPVVGPKSLTF